MTTKDKIRQIVEKYDDQLMVNNLKEFAIELARECGSVALERIGEVLETNLEYLILSEYVIVDGVVFTADKKRLVKYAPEKCDKSYVIPSFAETIDKDAFEGNKYLMELTIPENVKCIGSRAFANSAKLSKINWSGSRTAGSNVFVDCKNLKSIYTDDVDYIWNYLCDNDGSPFINGADLYVGGKLCEEITVPQGSFKGSLHSFKNCTSIKNIKFNEDNEYVKRELLDIINR